MADTRSWCANADTLKAYGGERSGCPGRRAPIIDGNDPGDEYKNPPLHIAKSRNHTSFAVEGEALARSGRVVCLRGEGFSLRSFKQNGCQRTAGLIVDPRYAEKEWRTAQSHARQNMARTPPGMAISSALMRAMCQIHELLDGYGWPPGAPEKLISLSCLKHLSGAATRIRVHPSL